MRDQDFLPVEETPLNHTSEEAESATGSPVEDLAVETVFFLDNITNNSTSLRKGMVVNWATPRAGWGWEDLGVFESTEPPLDSPTTRAAADTRAAGTRKVPITTLRMEAA